MAETYSQQTKRALTDVKFGTDGQLRAELSAICSTCGALVIDSAGYTLELTTQNRGLKERVDGMLGILYGAVTQEPLKSLQFDRAYSVLRLPYAVAPRVLIDCALKEEDGEFFEGIAPRLVDSTDDCQAYLRGAFLGGGTLVVHNGYALEFCFFREGIAQDFCTLLNRLELAAHMVERNRRFVVYMKDVQNVCDALAHMGAVRAVMDIQAMRAERMVKSKVVRQCNCEVYNAGKTISAAERTIEDIAAIQRAVGLDKLDEKLRSVAFERLRDPSESLNDLAVRLRLSKSGLKNRLSRIGAFAKKLREGNEKEENDKNDVSRN